jgi:dipeptide/tripeptide permease
VFSIRFTEHRLLNADVLPTSEESYTDKQNKSFGSFNMRSPRGFLATLVLLSAPPITALYQMLFDNGAGTVIHLALAAGFVLISFSVFDFKIARWITWIGCVSTSALAAIFLLQGLSELIQNDSLAYLESKKIHLK